MSWNLSSTVWYESSWDRSNTAGLGSPLPPGLSPKKHGEPERSTSISFSRCHQTQPTQPTHHDLLTSTFPSIKGHTGTLRVVSAVGLLADRVVVAGRRRCCLVSFFYRRIKKGKRRLIRCNWTIVAILFLWWHSYPPVMAESYPTLITK